MARSALSINSRYVVREHGFSLLEIIASIGILSILFYVVFGTSNIVRLQDNGNFQTIARQLIVQEAEALRAAPFSALANRDATPFIETAYNAGTFVIERSDNPYSPENILHVEAAEVSRLVVPTGQTTNSGLRASFLVRSSSPADWKVGIYSRYHDDQNHYLLTIEATRLVVTKRVNGVETQLWERLTSVETGTWVDIIFWTQGDTFNVTYGGQSFPTFVADASFVDGYNVLGTFDGADVDFDDVAYIDAVTTTWNFDGEGERVGQPPVGWRRAGPDLLPSGATSVTIADAQPGFTDLKRVTMTVQWRERNEVKSVTNTIYINEHSATP